MHSYNATRATIKEFWAPIGHTGESRHRSNENRAALAAIAFPRFLVVFVASLRIII